MKWSLKHAYENVAHYKTSFDAAGVHPDDLKELVRPAEISLHHQERPAGEFSLRHVRRADGQDRAHPCVVRHHRQADRGRLHQARHPDLGRRLRAQHFRERRTARHEDARGVRLRAVHRRARPALRRREARLPGDSGVGRHDRAPGEADRRFRARDDRRDAELHAGDPRRVPRAGRRSGEIVAADRHLRRRAVDQRDARRDRADLRHACDRHLRPLRGDRAGRRERMRRDQGRPARLGGSLLSRDHRPGDRRGAARRRRRASWCSPRSPRKACR